MEITNPQEAIELHALAEVGFCVRVHHQTQGQLKSRLDDVHTNCLRSQREVNNVATLVIMVRVSPKIENLMTRYTTYTYLSRMFDVYISRGNTALSGKRYSQSTVD